MSSSYPLRCKIKWVSFSSKVHQYPYSNNFGHQFVLYTVCIISINCVVIFDIPANNISPLATPSATSQLKTQGRYINTSIIYQSHCSLSLSPELAPLDFDTRTRVEVKKILARILDNQICFNQRDIFQKTAHRFLPFS